MKRNNNVKKKAAATAAAPAPIITTTNTNDNKCFCERDIFKTHSNSLRLRRVWSSNVVVYIFFFSSWFFFLKWACGDCTKQMISYYFASSFKSSPLLSSLLLLLLNIISSSPRFVRLAVCLCMFMCGNSYICTKQKMNKKKSEIKAIIFPARQRQTQLWVRAKVRCRPATAAAVTDSSTSNNTMNFKWVCEIA